MVNGPKEVRTPPGASNPSWYNNPSYWSYALDLHHCKYFTMEFMQPQQHISKQFSPKQLLIASLKASSRQWAIQWKPRTCMLLPLNLLTTPYRAPIITNAPSVAHATNLACHSSSLETSLIMLSVAWGCSHRLLSTSCIPTKNIT